MTDPIDIVAELRAGEDDPYIPHRTGEVMRDAADEIETLRREVTTWRAAMNYATKEDHR